MESYGALVDETVDVFIQMPWEILEEKLVKQLWDNAFLDSSIEGSPSFDYDLLNDLLKEATNICCLWANQNGDSNRNLWSVLVENNVDRKKMLVLLCLLTQKSSRRGAKISEKMTGLYGAGLYFSLLSVPGSRAFRIYQPNLFLSAVTSMRLPKTKVYSRKRGSKSKSGGTSKKSRQEEVNDGRNRGKRTKVRLASEASNQDESDDGSTDLQSEELDACFDAEDMEYFVSNLYYVIRTFSYLLEVFSLKDDRNLIEQIIQILVEIVRLETENSVIPLDQKLNDVDCKKNNSTFCVSQLAYNSLINLCKPLHGEETQNVIDLFKFLMPNILMSHARQFQTIPRHIQIVKDHSSSFVCYIIQKVGEKALKGGRILLQQLCVQMTDKAEFRSKVSQAINVILGCFPLQSYAKMVEWFFKLIRHAKINYRICALEIFLHLLSEPEKEIPENFPKSLELLLFQSNFIFAILSRCSDKAPSVRAKALTIFAVHANLVITALNKPALKIPTVLENNNMEKENLENENDADLIESDTKCLQQKFDMKYVMDMLLRRIKDNKVNVRKVTVQVIERIMCLDKNSVTEKYLQVVQEHCRDPAILVRKQALQSLTTIFETYKDSAITQQLWMKGVLPQLFDTEASIQEKCLEMIDCIIFQNLTSVSQGTTLQTDVAWKILNLVACGKHQDFQRYLQKAIHMLIQNGKIKGNMINNLKSHIEGSNDAAVWMLLAHLAVYTDFRDASFVINYWEEIRETKKIIPTYTIQRVLQVLGYLSNCIDKDKMEAIKDELELQLKQFLCPPELISAFVETLCKIYETLGTLNTEIQKIKTFCKRVLKDCDSYLSRIILENSFEIDADTEEQMIKRIFTLGELAQLSPASVPSRCFLLVQSIVASPVITNTVTQAYSSQSTQPSQICQTLPSQYNGSKMPPKVRAHAFIALGKLCLQNEEFAKKSVAALAKELISSSNPTIRNNIVIIMADLSVQYTLLVDPYISTITACLKDVSSFVRKQTLILLTQLLQEDYIKWKGTLFFRILITLIDEDPEIQNFVRYSLGHLVLRRHPHLFFQNFVESIFYYNCYTGHSSYNKFIQSQQEATLFTLSGSENKDKRMLMYKYMLENMSDEERFNLNLKLCQDILSAVPDIIPLNQDSTGLLQDALAILCCDEIKLTSLTTSVQDEIEDGDVAAAFVATAKKTIISHMVKKNVIENVVPIVISLKHVFEKVRSPLLKDLMLFLRELLKDYKSEVKEIMAADKQLAKEIEFDLRQFERQQEEKQENKLDKQCFENIDLNAENTEVTTQKASNDKTPVIKESAKMEENNSNVDLQTLVKENKTKRKSLGLTRKSYRIDIPVTQTPDRNSQLVLLNKAKTSNKQIMDKPNCSSSIVSSVKRVTRLVEEVAKRRKVRSSPRNSKKLLPKSKQNLSSIAAFRSPVILLEPVDKKVLQLSHRIPKVCLEQNILCQTPNVRHQTMPKHLFRAISTPSGVINNITFQTQEDISVIHASPHITVKKEVANQLSEVQKEQKMVLHLNPPERSVPQRKWKLRKSTS